MAYTSPEEVRLYTETFYKTLPGCTRDPARCHAFERAAEELLEKSVTDEVKRKVNVNEEMEEEVPSSAGDRKKEFSSKLGPMASLLYDVAKNGGRTPKGEKIHFADGVKNSMSTAPCQDPKGSHSDHDSL